LTTEVTIKPIPPGEFRTLSRADLNKLRQIEQDWPGVKNTLVRLSRHLERQYGDDARQHRDTIVSEALRAYDDAWRHDAEDPDRLAAFVKVLIDRIGDRSIISSSLGHRLAVIADSAMINPSTRSPDDG
jgi:hypothetical protein